MWSSHPRLPNAEPISIRAPWPLIQAARDDRRAAATLDEVRRLGVEAFRLNRGLLAFAQTVLAGRSGRPGRADATIAGRATSFVNCEAWADTEPEAIPRRSGGTPITRRELHIILICDHQGYQSSPDGILGIVTDPPGAGDKGWLADRRREAAAWLNGLGGGIKVSW